MPEIKPTIPKQQVTIPPAVVGVSPRSPPAEAPLGLTPTPQPYVDQYGFVVDPRPGPKTNNNHKPPAVKFFNGVGDLFTEAPRPPEAQSAVITVEKFALSKVIYKPADVAQEVLLAIFGTGAGAVAGSGLKSKVINILVKSPQGVAFSTLLTPEALNSSEEEYLYQLSETIRKAQTDPASPWFTVGAQWNADP